MQIKITGTKAKGKGAGKITRVKVDPEAIERNIEEMKSQMRVGPGGTWDIEVTTPEGMMARVDQQRVGKRDHQVGEFATP